MPDTTTQSGSTTGSNSSNSSTPQANGTGASGQNPSSGNTTDNKAATLSSTSTTSTSTTTNNKSTEKKAAGTTTTADSKEPVPTVDKLVWGYSKLDERSDCFQRFNGKDEYQVDLYLAPNFLNTASRFSVSSCIFLKWMSDVKQLSIHERLFEFGINGSAVVLDNLGGLSHVLEQFISYDLIIDISLRMSGKEIMRFEPYIMSIIAVEEIDWKNDGTRSLKIKFEDILTAEAKRHSIATLLKYNTDIKKTPTFPELYEKIYNYLADFIYENSNKAFTYGKTVRFKSYKKQDNSSLVKIIFDNIDPAKSIYDLIIAINKVACVGIYPDTSVTNNFEMIGDVLTPLFFKEEYPDMVNYYYRVHNEEGEVFTVRHGGVESLYIPRPFTLRSFYSPFAGAFNGGKEEIVFESFTTSEETDKKSTIMTINGSDPMPIRNFQTLSLNTNLATTRWKNIAFVSSNPHGGSNRLVFFNWMYEFFNQAFLQNRLNKTNIRLSNILPNFYLSHHGNDDLLNDKDIAEKNTNIIMLQNEKDDPVPEILMQVGKSIASLVFLNNLYSFEVEGNMFRRPNEVINLYTPHKTGSFIASQPVRTDFMRSDNVMLYVTEIFHNFDTNTFYDKIVCNRIYEQVPSK